MGASTGITALVLTADPSLNQPFLVEWICGLKFIRGGSEKNEMETMIEAYNYYLDFYSYYQLI